MEKLKELIRIKDPATIEQARKALEYFNEYRKAYPVKNNIETMDPSYSRAQQELATTAPSSKANALNTLDFEEEVN